MTEDEQEAATDQFLMTVGRYVIIFQWIESKVEQCLMLLWGHTEDARDRLSKMSNFEKVEALRNEFRHHPANHRGRARDDWVQRFESLIDRLHEERRQRNNLVHSHYLFDFLQIGHPVLQLDSRAGHRAFSADAQEEILRELGQLGWDMNLAQVQLVHDIDHKPPTGGGMGAT